MARKGKSTEEIIQALREAEVRLGQGETVARSAAVWGGGNSTLTEMGRSPLQRRLWTETCFKSSGYCDASGQNHAWHLALYLV